MALIVCNNGEKVLIEAAFKTTTPAAYKLRLYTSNTTPGATDTAGAYTEVDSATVTGYSAKTLARASWNSATTNGSGKGEITYADQTYSTSVGSATCYGWYMTENTGDTLIAAELLPTTKKSSDPFCVCPDQDRWWDSTTRLVAACRMTPGPQTGIL